LCLVLLPLGLVHFLGGCAGGGQKPDDKKVDEAADPYAQWPGWAPVPGAVKRDPALTSAAMGLCARGTDGVIDDDLRMRAGVAEGGVQGLLWADQDRRRPEQRREILAGMDRAIAHIRATHVGMVHLERPTGTCTAVVAARRLVDFSSPLPAHLPAVGGFVLSGRVLSNHGQATLFVRKPDGSVQRKELALGPEGKVGNVVVETPEPGSYLLEILVDSEADDPVVAAWWPFDVVRPNLPPAPELIEESPEDSDRVLSLRLGSLLARLRAQQDLDDLFIAPPLEALARTRAANLSKAGDLGHRLPDGLAPGEAMRAAHPQWHFSRLAEVQAQGASLAEAWNVLLSSPAHRFEMVAEHLSHTGAAVVRGKNGLGQDQVSVVVLLARRTNQRPASILAPLLQDALNLARVQKKRRPLNNHDALSSLARKKAEALAERGSLDNLDEAQMAAEFVEGAKGVDAVRVVVARVDDPLRIGPSEATQDPRARFIGIGLFHSPKDGQWYVCLVAGTPHGEGSK
jgi:uncharacterized protein YkwD